MNGPRRTSTSDSYVTPQQGDAWSDEAAARRRTGTQRLLNVGTVDADATIQHALSLAHGEHAVVRQRLLLEDDQPIELADSYYPERIAGGTVLAEHRKIRGGALRILDELGHAPAEVTDHLNARWPDSFEQAMLRIGEKEPLLVLTRISRDAAGMPVEYAVMRAVAGRSEGQTYQLRVSAS